MASEVCRLWEGFLPDGRFDIRISRPGWSADPAAGVDVNDPGKISFAASRVGHGQIKEVGTIPGSDTWVNFVEYYSDIPIVIVSVVRNGVHILQPWDTAGNYTGTGNYNRSGSLYVPVVEQTRIMVAKPALGTTFYSSLANDYFMFMTVQP